MSSLCIPSSLPFPTSILSFLCPFLFSPSSLLPPPPPPPIPSFWVFIQQTFVKSVPCCSLSWAHTLHPQLSALAEVRGMGRKLCEHATQPTTSSGGLAASLASAPAPGSHWPHWPWNAWAVPALFEVAWVFTCSGFFVNSEAISPPRFGLLALQLLMRTSKSAAVSILTWRGMCCIFCNP